jgi:hypothetical protein
MLRDSEILKTYYDYTTDGAKLLQDKYGRLWLHVFYKDSWNGHIQETFDLVENEQEADTRSLEAGYHYISGLPHFFASENFDFILHEDPMEETPGYTENKRNEIILLNQ